MGKREDLTGKKFGRLTVLNKVTGRAKLHWLCLCECGNTTEVATSNLKNGHTKSCGCLSKESARVNGLKSLQPLSGKRFGKLVAIKYDAAQKKWLCKCDCGKTIYVRQNNLCRKNNGTTSCGCDLNLDRANYTNIVEHTNVGNIKSQKLSQRNTSGVKGVYYNKTQGNWVAIIGFQNKKYVLCTSKDKDICIQARKLAEEKIFGDFLDWYNNEWKCDNE